MTTVVLADDQELVRGGLRALLTTRGVDVVAEAEHGLAAVHAARTHRPEVVVMGHPDAGDGRDHRHPPDRRLRPADPGDPAEPT